MYELPSHQEMGIDELGHAAVTSWRTNAEHWDNAMGDRGNDFFQVLELPALERLGRLQPGENALDLATGNGLVARWMLDKGAARVIASDVAEEMLDVAKKRLLDERITFRQVDVTNPVDFAYLHQWASYALHLADERATQGSLTDHA